MSQVITWKYVWVDRHEGELTATGDEGQQRAQVLRHLESIGVKPEQLVACYQHTITDD